MTPRLDRTATALAAAILLAWASVSEAQDATRATAPRAERPAAAAPATPTATPTATTTATTTQTVRDLRLSDVIGMDVRNARGENLGDVTDVVVDVETGRVAYAVVGIGGFLGIGEKLSTFPMSAFRLRQAGGPMPEPAVGAAAPKVSGRAMGGLHLVLDAEPQRLKRAPNFDSKAWPDWNDSTYRGEVDRAAGTNGSAKAGRMLRGSQLLDGDIRDANSENVGEVDDLVIDLRTGMVRYAVIDFDQAWTPDDKLVAVPMKALRPMGEKGELVFGGDRAQLARAPAFDKGRWPDLNGATFRGDVDRYLSSWRSDPPNARGTTGAAVPGTPGTPAAAGTTGR